VLTFTLIRSSSVFVDKTGEVSKTRLENKKRPNSEHDGEAEEGRRISRVKYHLIAATIYRDTFWKA
jgi:hypothetical protein